MGKNKDATPTGVSEEKQEKKDRAPTIERLPATPNPRNDLLEAIATRVEEDRAKEEGRIKEKSAEQAPPEKPADEKPVKAPETTPTDQTPATEKTPEEQPPPEQRTEDTVEIVVNGEKRQVPLSQVRDAGIRALQKESAADKRLEEATRLLKEAKEAGRTPEGQAPGSGRPAGPVPEPGPTPGDDSIRRWVEAIQYGTQDQAALAVREMLSRSGSQNAPDAAAIMRLVDQRYEAKRIQDQLMAPPEQGGYNDLMTDPDLNVIYVNRINQELAKGTPNDWTLYRTIGEDVRKKWAPAAKTETPGAPADFQAKKERKKSVDAVPGVTARQPTNPIPPPETPQDVIREIFRARGQMV